MCYCKTLHTSVSADIDVCIFTMKIIESYTTVTTKNNFCNT